jgi:DNA-binding NtrC family response regulator
MQPNAVKILVVDDDPGVLALLKATLSTTKHHITCCGSPSDAIQQLASGSFDVILSDYMMPGMTGLELLEIAATSSPDAIRFLLTAAATLDTAVDAMKAGKLDRLIRKPWGTAALLHAVEEAAYERAVRRVRQPTQPPVQAATASSTTDNPLQDTASTGCARAQSETPRIMVRRTDVDPLSAIDMLTDHF